MHTVKDLSTEELKVLIGEVVEEKLRDLLADPDAGLALRPELRDRLLKDLQEPRRDGENIPGPNWPAAGAWNGKCSKSNSALKRRERKGSQFLD